MIRFVLMAGLAVTATAADAASFDCNRARTPDEKAICANRALNDADVRMDTLFHVDAHLMTMGARGDLQDAQRGWMHKRQACRGDVRCLARAYKDRLADLQAAFDGIASRGPF